MRKTINIINVEIDQLNEDEAISRLIKLSDASNNGYVCFVNAHSVVTAQKDMQLNQALKSSAINCPDGVSVSKLMNIFGAKSQKRVGGPDFMLRLCSEAESLGKKTFLFGNTEETLSEIKVKLLQDYPGLEIAGMISPPFRPLTDDDNKAFVSEINSSGADFLFVSLGCPKQEIWMSEHYKDLKPISLGFGAAFDFYSGRINRAPKWMRENGLEWFHRLISDPRRLWKRYFITNSLYLIYASKQILMKVLFHK